MPHLHHCLEIWIPALVLHPRVATRLLQNKYNHVRDLCVCEVLQQLYHD